MKKDDKYYYWEKGQVYKFNNYFNTGEFACQCKYSDCVEQKIAIELIDKLTELRESINEPLTVTSGFRCTKHQVDLRKSGVNTVVASKSSHELGDAADIKPSRLSIPNLEKFSDKYFEAIGTAKTFLHVDLRKGKIRRWLY